MKTIGLIIEKDSFPANIPEEENNLPKEMPEAQTKDKPKKPSKPKKPPKEKEPPEIKAEESPSETDGEAETPEEKEPENGAD